MDDIGQDNVDEPIILPQPPQALKRSVRTKIRKPSLQGDGGGHRFAATRKGKVFTAAPDRYIPGEEHPPSSTSLTDHETHDPASIIRTTSPPSGLHDNDEPDAPWNDRPSSYSEESAIYDSYIDSGPTPDTEEIASAYTYSDAYGNAPEAEPQHTPQANDGRAPQSLEALQRQQYPQQRPPEQAAPQLPSQQTPLQHPSPQPYYQNLGVPPQNQQIPPARSPSPGSVSEAHSEQSTTPSTASAKLRSQKEKEKEKKGGLFGKAKWGGDKKDKPKGATSDRESTKEKEKESGFFGSLFGGGKKKQEDTGLGHGSGPATAAALLGQSRSSKPQQHNQNQQHPLASPNGDPNFGGPGFGYARYPIHVERAVYRLSHIKLANPRRPLHEQVLISNLMFWYLGIINKPTTPPATPSPAPAPAAAEGAAPVQQSAVAQNQGGPQPSAPQVVPPNQPSDYSQQHQQGPQQDHRGAEYHQQQAQARPAAPNAGPAAEREREQEPYSQPQPNGAPPTSPPPSSRREREREAPTGGRKNKSGDSGSNPKEQGSSRRKAEMPVKGPQYGMGMVIEQEAYDRQSQREQKNHNHGHNNHSPSGRPPIVHSPASGYAPSEAGSAGAPAPRTRTKPPTGPPSNQSQQQQYYDPTGAVAPNGNLYDPSNPDAVDSSPRNAARSPPPITRHPPSRSTPSSLPPGAMPPMQQSQAGIRAVPRAQSNVNASDNDDALLDQYYQPSSQPQQQQQPPYRSQSVPPREAPQPRSPPPQQPAAHRTPSYGSETSNANGRPKTSPTTESSGSGKLQGRSLSASAVGSDAQAGSRRSRSPPRGGPENPSEGASGAPRTRSRSRTREEGLPNTTTPPPPPALPSSISIPPGARGGDRQQRGGPPRSPEEEDIPLSVNQQRQREQQQYQQQQLQQQHYAQTGQLYQYQYQQPQQQPQPQSQDWNYARR